MSNELVLTEIQSEYDSLVEEVQKLKDEIASLTAEKDDLELHICRELQAEYDHKIGYLEYQIMAYNLEIERLRSIIEYLQAAVNRAEQVTLQEAEESADEKLQGFYEELDKKAKDIQRDQDYARDRWNKDQENAGNSGNQGKSQDIDWEEFIKSIHSTIGSEGSKDHDEGTAAGEAEQGSAKKNVNPVEEMKALYHKIVKALHPDMNPDITDREKELLNDAIKAYSAGDLERLREIAEIIDDADISSRFPNTPEGIAGLKALKEQLIRKRAALLADIDRIKNSFPYNIVDFLADDEAVAARRDELMKIIESCKETIAALNERIALLQKEMEE